MKAKRQLHVATVAAIRPDLIRLAPLIKRLDREAGIKHTFIWSNQHYDYNLRDTFFSGLKLREPDYNLQVGFDEFEDRPRPSEKQLCRLIELLPRVLTQDHSKPDLTLFLGDSNSVLVAPILKKLGFTIGHIEAGMRSNDFRMPEEINRRCCDLSSDLRFCYHQNYAYELEKEGFLKDNYVVGNTIKETFNSYIKPKLCDWGKKTEGYILVDLHRDELIKDQQRLQIILRYCKTAGEKYNLPVLILQFPRTMQAIANSNLDIFNLQPIPLLDYLGYMKYVYNAKFLISDSGTAQEEPCLLKTPVIVPRQFTERPISMSEGCSFMLINPAYHTKYSFEWLDSKPKMDTAWLGDGNTSKKIVNIIKEKLKQRT